MTSEIFKKLREETDLCWKDKLKTHAKGMGFFIPSLSLPEGVMLDDGEVLTSESALLAFDGRVDDFQTHCCVTLFIPLDDRDELGTTRGNPERLLVCAKRRSDGSRYMYCVTLPNEVNFTESEVTIVPNKCVVLTLKKKWPGLWWDLQAFGNALEPEEWGWKKQHVLDLYLEGARREWRKKERTALTTSW
jgi:hypothetical protein